jgi:hypothetical protein
MMRTSSALSVLVLALTGWNPQPSPLPAEKLQGRLILELAPGKEVVLRLEVESEDDFAELRVTGPDGRRLAQVGAPGSTRTGVSQFAVEFREEDPSALLSAYVPGTYVLRATMGEGTIAVGTAELDLALPRQPRILWPPGGGSVSASDLKVRWEGDDQVSGYEVSVDQNDDEGVVIKLPPEQHSLQIPDGVLAPGAEISIEVVAIGANGNRTLTEVELTTLPE